MFCDTHLHLFKEYYEDIDSVINNSINNGTNRFIVAGVSNDTNKEIINLVNKENVYGVLGIHSEEVNNYQDSDLEFIEDNIKNKKIIGIGEIGLDYHYEDLDKDKQKELFIKQLKLAEKYNIPVVIHSRDATNDTIEILKRYKVKGVIHSFSGSLEIANIYIKMGFILGINGVITFKNCNLKDVINNISLENIVLETDAPYLTPVPFRGKQNTPSYIKYIAEYISELKHISLLELADITNDNIKRIFDI